MSASTEKALARRVVLLEKRLMILTLRFEAMDKAAAIMGGCGPLQGHGSTQQHPSNRPRHLRVVR